MIRTRYKKVLLVAPQLSPTQLTADYKNVKHVHTINNIFPSIFEQNPDLVIFDYNYVGKDMEKIVRRLRTNNFYNKIKICCYKIKTEPKADGLLKAIGVDYFIYQDELQAAPKSKNFISIFSQLLDVTLLGGLVGNASN